MHIAIRADGGPDIGFGHLVRASSVAEVAHEQGVHVTLATATPEPAREVFPGATRIHPLPNRHEAHPFCRWLEDEPINAVFVDAYPVDTDYQQAIRERAPLVVHQDDARHTICAEALVNGNLYASDLDYQFVGKTPATYLGPEYALLRKEVREMARNEPPWLDDPDRALITMGGSDFQNLTPTIIRAFDGFELTVDAIVGPGFADRHERAIRRAAKQVTTKIRVRRDPDDLVERMFEADFAVCTASSTVYELLALGTPIISIPVAANQWRVAEKVRDLDLAFVPERDHLRREVQQVIERYVADGTLRSNRRERGRTLVDGNGSERTTEILLANASNQRSTSSVEHE